MSQETPTDFQPKPPVNEDPFAHEQEGFHQGLGARQLQMIAIGSAIGAGLFLGAGAGLESAGPSLAIMYAVCGFFGYLILRALGELIVHRPSSGSFVSYTREFYGEKSAYVAGWLYWLNWAMTAVADATAIAIYISWFGQYSETIAQIPQWAVALVVVIAVVSMNLISVKVFGELEFWFALIKVSALLIFMVVGICFLIFGTPTGAPVGISLIAESGGILPNSIFPALIVMQGVVFAYAGIELVGTTSGETKNVEKIIPRAINTVVIRIAVFYVGSVVLLCLLLPYTRYTGNESPFVTFFESVGVDYAAPVMQLVVITAAASSMNAGMYSTGRILHSMAVAGSAPKMAAKLSRGGVPVAGILFTAVVALFGVALNYWVPAQAFEIVLNIAAIGTMASWVAIVMSHQKFLRLVKKGKYTRPNYRAPGGIFADWAVIVFILLVLVLTAYNYPVGTWTLLSMLIVVPLLWGGWFLVRRRVYEYAALRDGYTGKFPVIARTPGSDFYHGAGVSQVNIRIKSDDNAPDSEDG